MHYFHARMLYRREDVADFKDLLRSRRRDSYILCRIFEESGLPEEIRDDIRPYLDSLANYCLARRQDVQKLSLDMDARLRELADYLPEMSDLVYINPVDYLLERNKKLELFVQSEWLA